MSRYDQDNIEHLDLPDPVQTKADYYTDTGEVIDRDEYGKLSPQPVICAKEVRHIETGVTTYFILCTSNGQLFDPRETDTRYRKRSLWSFRRVKGTAFDTYLRFLKQKYTSLLRQAERGL